MRQIVQFGTEHYGLLADMLPFRTAEVVIDESKETMSLHQWLCASSLTAVGGLIHKYANMLILLGKICS